MISTLNYFYFMPFQFNDSFLKIGEAAFQTVCSQYMFFHRLRPTFTSVYGLLSHVTIRLHKLCFCLKQVVAYFNSEGISFDFSFIFKRDLPTVNNLSFAEHQIIGEKIRLFMMEVIVVSAGIKEKYGVNPRLYKLFKNLYLCLFELRNSIVEKLNNLTIDCSKSYYICQMSNIPNSFAYQCLIVKALSLEVDLPFYNNYLTNASCLNDFP